MIQTVSSLCARLNWVAVLTVLPITTFTVILYSKCIVPVHLVDMIILPCCVDSINV